MYLNKQKVTLVISISLLISLLIYSNTIAQNVQVTDGDTIKVNGKKLGLVV